MSDAHHDDWFKHTPGEGSAQEAHGAINAPFIIAFLAAVIIITFSLIFIILGYVGREVAEAKVNQSELRTDIFASENIEARENWQMDLDGDPRWVDIESRRVHMPIDYAAREVVARYAAGSGN